MTAGPWPFRKEYTIKGTGVITVLRDDGDGPVELEFGVGGQGNRMQAVFLDVKDDAAREKHYRRFCVAVNRMGGGAENHGQGGKRVLGDLALL